MLTCRYGLRRTDRTPSIDLRIKRRRPCHIPAIYESDHRLTTGTLGSSAWAMSMPPVAARSSMAKIDTAPYPPGWWCRPPLLDCPGRVRRVEAKPHAVASRALTRQPRAQGMAAIEEDWEDQGAAISTGETAVRRAISVPLAPVTRGL